MLKAWHVTAGEPHLLGATLDADGCNFAIHSPDATAVELCLFHPQSEELVAVVPLPAKSGKIWHCHISGIGAGQLYGYRIRGEHHPEAGFRFDPEKLLIDPYAQCLNRPVVWDAERYENDNQALIPKSVVVQGDFDWQGVNKPKQSLAQTVVYEAHVKGLTQRNKKVPEALRGTYLGVCAPAMIKHYQALGITAIQLLPVCAYMPEPFITEKGLTNYWGYNPINFFSPEPRYAIEDPVIEFKTMVRTLHKAGIQVILDVVYNHTAEGSSDGQTLSFKGADNRGFYLFDQDESGGVDFNRYASNSGCGNSINTANPYPLTMVMDSLRYWVQEMGVDGFRFDLAASLGRNPHDYSAHSAMLMAIRQDPCLRGITLIAEPWDCGNNGYRLGQFPSNWQECNDKYRDTVRGFWRGDKGITSDFATRLLGSRDLFAKGHRSIHSSVNHITYHDGFTLQDVVCYKERHNEANLEDNRDGHGHNVSANYGREGPSNKPDIVAIRERQKRNMFATLLLSQGIPHMLAGDELSRTQKGNNNAYCQDNEISWLNWKLNPRAKQFLRFCQQAVALRKRSKLLQNLSLEDDNFYNHHNVAKVGWYRPDGCRKVVDDWHDPDNQSFGVELHGEGNEPEHWFIVFNASDHDIRFNLPKLADNEAWYLQLDTRYMDIDELPDVGLKEVLMQTSSSLSVLLKRKG